jgi:hypothetical protein
MSAKAPRAHEDDETRPNRRLLLSLDAAVCAAQRRKRSADENSRLYETRTDGPTACPYTTR